MASAGGETPARFRRRVLLERAAYRLAHLTRMVQHHTWLTGGMIERARRLPAEVLDKPVSMSVDDDRQTLRSLLSRLVGQMDTRSCAIANRPYAWSVEENEELAAMRERLARVAPAFLREIRDVIASGRLDETFVDAICEPAELFTYGGMIAHVLTFAARRRTLAALALCKAGVEDLGWGDPMKWVAEPA